MTVNQKTGSVSWAVLALSFAAQTLAAPPPFPTRPEPTTSTGEVVVLPDAPTYNPRTNPNPAWGTTAASIRQIHAYQFVPIDSSITYSYISGMRYRTGGSMPWFDASLSLPTGVTLLGFELFACDSDVNWDIYAYLITSTSTYGGQLTSGTPGCGYFYYDLSSASIQVDNLNVAYTVEVTLTTTGTNLRFRSVNIYYRLNVSPAPAFATFADVPPTHPFFQYVEALAASGITSGCGGGNFCPNNPVTRGQMAVFLSKALGLHYPY